VRLNRRHSLPGGSSGTDTSSGGTEGCVIEIHGDRETGSEGSEEISVPETQSSTAVLVTDDLVKVNEGETCQTV